MTVDINLHTFHINLHTLSYAFFQGKMYNYNDLTCYDVFISHIVRITYEDALHIYEVLIMKSLCYTTVHH